MQLIATATAASDINVKDAALRQIETFFKSRIAKKSSENERDGSAAVKRAIMSSRSPAGAGTVASDKLPDS